MRVTIGETERWMESLGRISEGINRLCVDPVRTALIARCLSISSNGQLAGAFDEDEYLAFSKQVLATIANDARGAQLALDLSRVTWTVSELPSFAVRWLHIEEVALQRPYDYTDANQVLVRDIVYTALNRRAVAVLRQGGVQAFIDYVRGPVFTHAGDQYDRRSVVKYGMDFVIRDDHEALAQIDAAFGSEPGIARDLAKRRAWLARNPGT